MSTQNDEPLIATNSARHVFGAPRVRGFDVYEELVGEDFWSQLSISIGFRRLSPRQCKLFDVMASCLLVADPRIWFLRAARTSSSFGRLGPGIASISLLLETTRLTGAMKRDVADFYQAYRLAFERHPDEVCGLIQDWFEAFGGAPPGFDNQAKSEDERHVQLMKWLRHEREYEGLYVQLHRGLCEKVRDHYGALPNFVSLVVALMLDMGFSSEHIPPFIYSMMSINALNNVVEAQLQRSPSLKVFPEKNVKYVGPKSRKSPRGQGAHDQAG